MKGQQDQQKVERRKHLEQHHKRLWSGGKLLFILVPLTAAGLAERRLEQTEIANLLSHIRLVVLVGGSLLLVLLVGWGWRLNRPPSAPQARREAVRRHERMMLFRLAQGKMPWYAHKAAQAVLAALGLCFVLTGLLLEIHAAGSAWPSRVGPIILGIGSGLGGLILLLETLIVLPRRLRHLPSLSASALKHQLLRGEQLECHASPEQYEEPE